MPPKRCQQAQKEIGRTRGSKKNRSILRLHQPKPKTFYYINKNRRGCAETSVASSHFAVGNLAGSAHCKNKQSDRPSDTPKNEASPANVKTDTLHRIQMLVLCTNRKRYGGVWCEGGQVAHLIISAESRITRPSSTAATSSAPLIPTPTAVFPPPSLELPRRTARRQDAAARASSVCGAAPSARWWRLQRARSKMDSRCAATCVCGFGSQSLGVAVPRGAGQVGGVRGLVGMLLEAGLPRRFKWTSAAGMIGWLVIVF